MVKLSALRMNPWIIVILLCLLGLESFGAEMRGLWVDAFGTGFRNKKEVTQLVEHCRKYNFNAVFVQMRKRGDAYYLPQAPNEDVRAATLPADYDALAEIIRHCHAGEPRIEVHCWVVGYFVWAFDKPPPQADHVFNRHPDWLTRDAIGQKLLGQGYYLDPGHPEVTRSLSHLSEDIVRRYDIDGFHWDYLRYPSRNSGYNPTALQRYKKEMQRDHATTTNRTELDPAPDDPRFSEWRRRQVTNFLRCNTADLLEIKPKLVVSVAVFSSYKDSRDHRMADWVEWNKEGILDAAVPMDFSTDNKLVFNPRTDFAAAHQGIRTVWIGQAAYMNKKENTLAQLLYARSLRTNQNVRPHGGTVIYDYNTPMLPSASKKTGIIIDNRQAEALGTWKTAEFGKRHGEDYLVKTAADGESHVKFSATLRKPGTYEVYEWHTAGTNRAEQVPHVIIHERGTHRIPVNQRSNGSAWNLLGTFPFATTAEVRVTDGGKGKNKVVIADALKFVLVSTNMDEPMFATATNTKATETKLAQETAFALFKEKYQPEWEPIPELPWKNKPTTGIIKGTVISRITGQPVDGAVISIIELPTRTQKTDSHGKFAFFEIPSGSYTVQTSVPGLADSIEKKGNLEPGGIVRVTAEIE